MEKVYVFLADGFEEIEGLTVVDILRRAGIETVMVSVMKEQMVKGSHGIEIKADMVFDAEKLQDGTVYVLPGGMPGTKHLAAHEELGILIKKACADGRKVAAICAAPTVLGGLGILQGRKAVCYPGMEDGLTGAVVTKETVAVSGNVTTSRGMGTAIPFALSLVAQLQGKEAADRMAAGIVWAQ